MNIYYKKYNYMYTIPSGNRVLVWQFMDDHRSWKSIKSILNEARNIT